MPPGIEDPASVPVFKTSTSAFAAKHPNARFASNYTLFLVTIDTLDPFVTIIENVYMNTSY